MHLLAMLRATLFVAAAMSLSAGRGAVATRHDGLRASRPPPPPPPPVDPALLKLEKKYNATRTAACAKVLPHVPVLDATDAASFMAAYKAGLQNLGVENGF